MPCDERKNLACVISAGAAGNASVCKPTAPACNEKKCIKRSWLIDTGCPFDFAAAGDLQDDDCIVDNNEGIVLATANGPVEDGKAVQLQIGPLLEHIEALVLDGTPLVLNVGNRCKLQGYGFHWNPFSNKPYFELPNGKGKLILREHDGCAFLDDDDPVAGSKPLQYACPAPDAEAKIENDNSTALPYAKATAVKLTIMLSTN